MPGEDFSSPDAPPEGSGEFGSYDTPNYLPGQLTVTEEARRADLYDAAYALHRSGLRVIPVHWMKNGACSCGHDCGDSAGKHPIGDRWNEPGDDSRNDLRWWRIADISGDISDWEPNANIGILTGEASGIFAVDTDPKHGGDIRFQQLADEHLSDPVPDTVIVQTGSGGRHYYFAWPGHHVINSKPWGKAAGVDIKGDGGFIVAPVSVSGIGPYSFASPLRDRSAIPSAPAWILDKLGEIFHRQLGEAVDDVPAVPDRIIGRYIGQAVAGEAMSMRHAPQGDRNNTLNRCAFTLGTLGAHGLLAEAEAYAALSEAAAEAGLGAHEIRGTFLSGWRKGLLTPRDLRGVGQLHKSETAPPPMDEFGLGDRLVIYFGETIRWVTEWQQWAICIDGVWHKCGDSEPERLAQAVIRMLPRTEAPFFTDDTMKGEKVSNRKRWEEWYAKQRTRAKISNMVRIARDRPAIRALSARFDENPYWLNCRNGVYDGDDRRLVKHEPDHLLTMQAGVKYDPDAICPLWDMFLERVQPDPDVRAYLYRIWGYSLTGVITDRAFFMHHGEGANGKSVANSVIMSVLGSYGQTVPVKTFELAGSGSEVPSDVARMDGKRYLAASETRAGKHLNDALVKLLSGGDTVAARFLYQEFFEFRPTGKLHIISNHVMHMPADPSIQSRLHLIPWEVVIPDDEQDKHLATRIFEAEGSGVLNRLLAGMQDWREIGKLGEPVATAEHRTDFLRSEDWRYRFVEECCNAVESAPGAVGRSTRELFARFEIWWRDNERGQRPSVRTFSHGLKSLYTHKETTVRGQKWNGFPGLEVRPFNE